MSRLRLVDLFACALALTFAWAPAFAVTIILIGTASDSSTGAAVVGADVTLRQGGTDLGSTVTGTDGQFRLPFDIANQPQASNLKLTVKRESFLPLSQDVVVASGRASKTSFEFQLVPQAVAECIRTTGHMVVVGYFRPAPESTGDPDIAARVAEALERDLLPRMQQKPGPQSLPSIIACGTAKPRAAADYTRFAKVLHADAFLTGSVNKAALAKVKVDMAVVDQLGLLSPPLRSSSRDVNLEDAEASRLDVAANKDILIALVGGYEKAGKYDECVDFTSAAARILGSLPNELAEARKRCQQRVANRGLLATGGAP
jgi:hypothetical protein